MSVPMKYSERYPKNATLWLAMTLLVSGIGFTLRLSAATGTEPPAPSLYALSTVEVQRQTYRDAIEALQTGQRATFADKRSALSDYPLAPYLDYFALKQQLTTRPYPSVDEFLTQYKRTSVADQLRSDWLNELARQKRWHDYLTYFELASASTEQTCYQLWARIQTGDQSALEDVGRLWNVPRSQPNGCDPLFKIWTNSGGLTAQIAWERFSSALEQRKYRLARYLRNQLPQEIEREGSLLWDVHYKPEKVNQSTLFNFNSPYLHDIILYGVKRYARGDALSAMKVWERYDSQRLFDDEERKKTQLYIANALVRQNQPAAAEKFSRDNSIPLTRLTEERIVEALREQNWPLVYEQLQALPITEQQEDRWQYWRARAMEQLAINNPPISSPQLIYAQLAKQRGFYGFLSSDILGQQYSLVDNPVRTSQELVEAVADIPAIQRARELFALGEINAARREWRKATKEFTDPALLAAGKLAQTWGWYRKSIEAMIEAKYWDDLGLRFPLAYQDSVSTAAQSTQIAPTLLYAITRQESAFAHDARSPVGALGLMQLMPATAKETARKAGIRYKNSDLLTPTTNIHLGSNYLGRLLEQFNGNRILAAAAYNAGPYRVTQWLKRTGTSLPYDIWIETIPFKETRHYVQNVLAYSVIYGYRLGESPKMINAQEAEISL